MNLTVFLLQIFFFINPKSEDTFFLENFLKLWGPYIIFAVGYFLTWRKSQLDKRNQDKTYKNLVLKWILLAKNRTEEQSKNCIDFAKDIVNSKFIDSARYKSGPLMFERLNDLDVDKLIRPFVFNANGDEIKNLQNFNSLIANINFLVRVEIELKNKYEATYASVQSINELFNASFLKIETIFFKKVTEVGNERGHKDLRYLRTLNDFRTKWEKEIENPEDGATAIHTFKNLIKPSLDFIKSSFNKDKENAFLFEMYDELNNMMIVKRRWEVYKKGTSEIFKQYGEQIKASFEDLEKNVNYFQNIHLVSVWKIK